MSETFGIPRVIAIPPVKKRGQILQSTDYAAEWVDPTGTTLSSTWSWTTSTGAPSARYVGINTAAWSTATVVNISKTTGPGGDATNVLATTQPGSKIYLQDSADATKWGRYQTTALGTDNGTWFSFPVTFLEGGATLPANNRDTYVAITTPGAGGGGVGLPADTVVPANTRIISNKFVAADANPSWRVLGDGSMQWGAGGASALDLTLARDGGGNLIVLGPGGASSGGFFAGPIWAFDTDVATDAAFQASLWSDNYARFQVNQDGKIQWGTGAASSFDTNLYRASAGVLKTDGVFNAVGGLQVNGVPVVSGGDVTTYNTVTNFGPTGVTTTGNGDIFFTFPAATFAAVLHYWELSLLCEDVSGNANIEFRLHDGTAPGALICAQQLKTPPVNHGSPVILRFAFTPSAGSHTFQVRWRDLTGSRTYTVYSSLNQTSSRIYRAA